MREIYFASRAMYFRFSLRWKKCLIETGKCKALLLISPKTIFEIRWKNIKEPCDEIKKLVQRIGERNSNVSRSERKRTITIDGDDQSNTSECDIDEQKDESEG